MFSIRIIEAMNRLNNEIAVWGSMSGTVKPGSTIFCLEDCRITLRVKGIESLNFVDKERHVNKNPWLIVEAVSCKPNDLIGRNFYIREEYEC